MDDALVEKVAVEHSVNDIADTELLRRAIANCRKKRGRHWQPLWASISARFSLGSTYSMQLCQRFGFDPHEQVRP